MEARKVRGLIVRCGLRCGRLVDRRAGGVSIRSGFGTGLLVGCRAMAAGVSPAALVPREWRDGTFFFCPCFGTLFVFC